MPDDQLPTPFLGNLPAGGKSFPWLAAVMEVAVRDNPHIFRTTNQRQADVDQNDPRDQHAGGDGPATYEYVKGHFRKAWQEDFPVEQLQVGDHFRHKSAGWSERVITGVKPHPKGGVQVKSVPAYFRKPGKTMKHDLTGVCSRWDGRTEVEVASRL